MLVGVWTGWKNKDVCWWKDFFLSDLKNVCVGVWRCVEVVEEIEVRWIRQIRWKKRKEAVYGGCEFCCLRRMMKREPELNLSGECGF